MPSDPSQTKWLWLIKTSINFQYLRSRFNPFIPWNDGIHGNNSAPAILSYRKHSCCKQQPNDPIVAVPATLAQQDVPLEEQLEPIVAFQATLRKGWPIQVPATGISPTGTGDLDKWNNSFWELWGSNLLGEPLRARIRCLIFAQYSPEPPSGRIWRGCLC